MILRHANLATTPHAATMNRLPWWPLSSQFLEHRLRRRDHARGEGAKQVIAIGVSMHVQHALTIEEASHSVFFTIRRLAQGLGRDSVEEREHSLQHRIDGQRLSDIDDDESRQALQSGDSPVAGRYLPAC
jgi:hypothetical protein